MTVRELVFSYQSTGASEAVRKDKQVRQSVRRTGKAANQQAGSVRRWAERNRDSIRKISAAMLGFAAGIASASPTLRANLSGVRTAISLVADTIVRDLLPSGGSLASLAIDLAQRFRNLDDSVRRPISALIGLLTVFSAIAIAAGPVIGGVKAIVGVMSTLVGALGPIISIAATVVKALGTIAAAVVGLVTVKALLVGAVIALAAALILNVGGARDKVLGFLSDLASGTRQRMSDWATAIREAAARARDWAVGLVGQLKERTLALLSLGREMAGKGREWVAGLASGVRQRAGQLLSAFRSMATRAAQAFRDRFNAIIPSSISIPSVSINIPDILGGGRRTVGGGSLRLPQLDTGGRIASDGLAMLHAGERIMPAAQVRERGPQPTGESGTRIEEVTIMVMGTGDGATDGRNVARAFQRELEDRGA